MRNSRITKPGALSGASGASRTFEDVGRARNPIDAEWALTAILQMIKRILGLVAFRDMMNF